MDDTNSPVTGVQNISTDEIMRTPAFMATNPQNTTLDSSPNAGLSIFANPVEGNIDTGVMHDGDLGGAG
jgi:hypothetical protein